MGVDRGGGGGGGWGNISPNIWSGAMACIIIPHPHPQYFKVECHIIPTKYLKYQQK